MPFSPDERPIEPPAPLSAGERAVLWCLEQYRTARVPSRELLASWAKPVGRGLDRMILAGTRLNHCAMAQSAAMLATIDEEIAPHGYRAGARQLMDDAVARGVWHKAAELKTGWRPRSGDLCIYDRSVPGRPETAWHGHVDRIQALGEVDMVCIGANEGPGGAWVIAPTRYDHPKLLGTISYPAYKRDAPRTPPKDLLTPDEVEHVQSLVALSLAQSAGGHA